VSVPREYQDRGGRRAQRGRRTACESSQSPDEGQLELQDELDTLDALAEGFDGWDVFDRSEDEAA
jgi:hypothetical protein